MPFTGPNICSNSEDSMKCIAKLVSLSLDGPYPFILRTVSDQAVDLPSYQKVGGGEGFYTWPLLVLKGWAIYARDVSPPILKEQEGVEIVFENDEESLSFLFLHNDFIGFIERLEKDGRLMGHNWDLDEMARYIAEADDDPKPVSYSFGLDHLS
jgi:hypothetical protein